MPVFIPVPLCSLRALLCPAAQGRSVVAAAAATTALTAPAVVTTCGLLASSTPFLPIAQTPPLSRIRSQSASRRFFFLDAQRGYLRVAWALYIRQVYGAW